MTTTISDRFYRLVWEYGRAALQYKSGDPALDDSSHARPFHETKEALVVAVAKIETERDAAVARLDEAEARINRMQVALSDIEQYVRLGDDEGIWGATSRALGWLQPGDLDHIDPTAATDGGAT